MWRAFSCPFSYPTDLTLGNRHHLLPCHASILCRFSHCMTKLGLRIAPWYVATHFASELHFNLASWGYHKPWLARQSPLALRYLGIACPAFRTLWEYLTANALWPAFHNYHPPTDLFPSAKAEILLRE